MPCSVCSGLRIAPRGAIDSLGGFEADTAPDRTRGFSPPKEFSKSNVYRGEVFAPAPIKGHRRARIHALPADRTRSQQCLDPRPRP